MIIKNILWVVVLSLLFGCAVEVKKVVKIEPEKPKRIILEKGIQQKFDEAVSFINNKNFKAAIRLLEKVIKKEKRLVAPYVNLGMAYSRLGNVKLAEFYLRSAVEIDLGHAEANNELGLLYRKIGRFSDAHKALSNALADHSDYLPALKNLGILCDLYMQDYECALKAYDEYIDIDDDPIIKIWVTDLKQRMK